MFARRVHITYRDESGAEQPCPIAWIDNFAMRNFTNDAVFDDTLPVADGVLEVGNRVPVGDLQVSMDDWFHRKGYLNKQSSIQIELQS